jgi:hypothetical protein
MPFILSRNRLVVCVLFLFTLLLQGPVSTATAQVTGSAPVLSVATPVVLPSTLIVVQGQGFTPGGLVYVAIYDRWGEHLHEHVWAIAGHGHLGVSGSHDPNLGYVPAGTLDVVIDHASPGEDEETGGISCGRDLMVRAYDQQAAAWSNLLDVTARC